MTPNLDRFIPVQSRDFERALHEVRRGKKVSHWMWYIFPQLRGLGQSYMAEYYGLDSLDEAKSFFENDYLRNNLLAITSSLIELNENDPVKIFGTTDAMKLKSSMTLFDLATNCPIFRKVLDKYFGGKQDKKTLELLEKGEQYD